MIRIPRCSIYALLCGALLVLGTSWAAAPLAGTQAPGFLRFQLGDVEVTALLDGVIELQPSQLLRDIPTDSVALLLAHDYQQDPVPTSVNAFLINTGSRLVLVDSGAGVFFGPGLGAVTANMRASGYQPEQVDDVLITHVHGDHVGGLVQAGARVYPNATLHIQQLDLDHWLDPAQLEQAPEDHKGSYRNAQTALTPYLAAERLVPIHGDEELVPGIRSLAAPGHTPGHSLFVVESQGQTLELWGDLLHVAAVQLPRPQTTILFDSDRPTAARERQTALARAAQTGVLIGGAHLAFPGLGRIRSLDGQGYEFIPLPSPLQ